MALHRQRSPGLWSPTQSPEGPVVVDRNHPLASGLSALFLLNGGPFLNLVGSDIGTMAGSGTNTVASSRGAVLSVPGSGAGNVASSASFDLSGDMTISGWVYTNSLGTEQSICAKTNNNLPAPFDVNFGTTGVINFTRGNGTAYEIYSGGTPITAGAWTHVAVTSPLAATSAVIYVNGIGTSVGISASGNGWTGPGTVANGTNNLMFGSRTDRYTQLNGMLSTIKLYKRVLSPGEVLLDYLQPFGLLRPAIVPLRLGASFSPRRYFLQVIL